MLISICFAAASLATAQDKPNVIVIVADDLGYADVGFHDVVADGVNTPNIDKLADSGVIFHNAYSSSPVCSNSRLALSTGRYQQRWGAYYYGDGGLPSTENTIAEMMREAGYRTMKVGKTHLNKGPKEDPMKHGFDNYFGVNICALCLPPRGKPSTPSTADKPRRGITATKRFVLRGLMFRA